jgi:alkanesulfonate monooxygenase SsuD/methylene tetrahydromethanopterin reductase-like flavin-dependent oxidoreductase (luciferase family)
MIAFPLPRETLSPALGRAPEEIEKLLPLGDTDECVQRLNKLADAGAQRVHLWPVADYPEQLEILAKEVMPSFK